MMILLFRVGSVIILITVTMMLVHEETRTPSMISQIFMFVCALLSRSIVRYNLYRGRKKVPN